MIVAVPVASARGATSSVRTAPAPPTMMLAAGTTLWLLDPVVTINWEAGRKSSPMMNSIGPSTPFLLIRRFRRPVIVGGAFAGMSTWSTIRCSVKRPPSSAMRKVIVVTPSTSGAGVMVTERDVPLPPKTMLPFGTIAGDEEVAERIRFAGGVPSSPTVNVIGPRAWLRETL